MMPQQTPASHTGENINSDHSRDSLDSIMLTNRNGMRVTILNYGATMARIEVPDRDGSIGNVLLGHEDLSGFVGGRFYLGATVGRVANRIAGGRFSLDGREYRLSGNNKGNMLHGGFSGFDKKIWDMRTIQDATEPGVELTLVSPDGDEGFPGEVTITTRYTLTAKNELAIRYTARTDQPTMVNLTNHAYFNLSAFAENSILNHVLTIDASAYTPIDDRSIPTGEVLPVEGTPLDFRTPTAVGARIGDNFNQLTIANGYDHNFVLGKYDGSVRTVATLYEPVTGRVMEVSTDQPGMQFYSGNYLDGALRGCGGAVYTQRSGLCLECQHYPNSPNEPKFPSVIVRPGSEYRHNTIYKFSIA
jgi:aldose 1-epimerase